jgi:hypothetical protein
VLLKKMHCIDHLIMFWKVKSTHYLDAKESLGRVFITSLYMKCFFSAIRRWDKFEESYRVMQFSNGDRCWNGPDRSLKVCISSLLLCLPFVNSNSFHYLHSRAG